MSKKILIPLVVVILILTGWIAFNLISRRLVKSPTPLPEVSPVEEAAKLKPEPTAAVYGLNSGEIYLTTNSQVTFNYPRNWGEFIKPTTNEMGDITAPQNLAESFLAGGCASLCGQNSIQKTFTQYPFSDPEDSTITGITLGTYPEKLVGDPADEGPDLWDKAAKEGVLEAMKKIYNQRSLNEIDITSKHLANLPDKEGKKDSYFYGIVSSVNATTDPIAPQYIENEEGTFRGLAFFKNEGQDITFTPAYYVALINPSLRSLLVLEFRLNNIPEIASFIQRMNQYSNSDQYTEAGMEKIVAEGYTYLENRSQYQSAELGKVIAQIENLVRSLRLRMTTK